MLLNAAGGNRIHGEPGKMARNKAFLEGTNPSGLEFELTIALFGPNRLDHIDQLRHPAS